MKNKLFPGLAATFFASCIICSQAQAAHIQFFDYADLDGNTSTTDYLDVNHDAIIIDDDDTYNLVVGDTFTWTFDLLVENSLDLFDIEDNYASLGTGAFDDLNDHLHQLTLRIDPNNTSSDPTSNYVQLKVNNIIISQWSNPTDLYSWGVPLINLFSNDYGIPENDYKIEVELYNFGNRDITINNINIEGCFDDVAPVPEPATMLLFGTGLAGLIGSRLRRKKK